MPFIISFEFLFHPEIINSIENSKLSEVAELSSKLEFLVFIF